MLRLITLCVLACALAYPAPSLSQTIVFKTNLGDVTLELYEDKAPITVKNFLSYLDKEGYNGTIFHRVIDGFMIQGGGYDLNNQALAYHGSIKNEASNGLSNLAGTLAMARKNHPDSANRQFFINLVDNKRLDYPNYGGGYCVFGRVTKGFDILKKIAQIPVKRQASFAHYPTKPAYIVKAERVPVPSENKTKPSSTKEN